VARHRHNDSRLFGCRGNVAGFDAAGRPVMGAKTGAGWRVWRLSQAQDIRTFATAAEADTYAESLIDPQQTEQRKWW
jgi:hypothetical protein